MTTSAQIRLLLAVVCTTFLLTAIIVKETFTPKVNLQQTGTILKNNLNEQETYIRDFINDKKSFEALKTLPGKPAAAINTIQNFTTDNRIWVYTYHNNHLSFWSGVKILPENPLLFKEGANFIKKDNGYYEVVKKSSGNFTALFWIPVKATYHFQNRYLHNVFDRNLLHDNNIDIADFADKQVFDIRTIDNAYLFSVKLKPGNINHRFYYFEVALWLLGFITLCTLVHNICSYIAGKAHPLISFFVLAAFIVTIRFININYNWPDLSAFDIFNPRLYASSRFFSFSWRFLY